MTCVVILYGDLRRKQTYMFIYIFEIDQVSEKENNLKTFDSVSLKEVLI